MSKKYDVERFLKAQSHSYRTALEEVKDGSKESHWIWYIFPQMKGLGMSYTADLYGIANIEEAREYLQNETLKERLIEISTALLNVEGRTARDIFGGLDAIKVRSSMTLFHLADPEEQVFKDVLKKYYNNELDDKTLKIIAKQKRGKELISKLKQNEGNKEEEEEQANEEETKQEKEEKQTEN